MNTNSANRMSQQRLQSSGNDGTDYANRSMQKNRSFFEMMFGGNRNEAQNRARSPNDAD